MRLMAHRHKLGHKSETTNAGALANKEDQQ